MAAKRKASRISQASRDYLARKSVRQVSRLLRHRRGTAFLQKKRGRYLKAATQWQKWEMELLGKQPDRETARQIGRTAMAVKTRRCAFHIPSFNEVKVWQEWEVKLLGRYSDQEVVRQTGRTLGAVQVRRHILSIERFGGAFRPRWESWELDLLGKHPDAEVVRRTGRTAGTVCAIRRFRQIERFGGKIRRWTKREDRLLRQYKTDEEIARITSRTIGAIVGRRAVLKIPCPVLTPRQLRKAELAWKRAMRVPRPIDLRQWTQQEDALLGTMPDSALARQTSRNAHSFQCGALTSMDG